MSGSLARRYGEELSLDSVMSRRVTSLLTSFEFGHLVWIKTPLSYVQRLGENRNASALVMRMGTNLTQTSASTAKKSNRSTNKEWKKLIAEYQQPHVGKAVWQIVNTLVPIAAILGGVVFPQGHLPVALHPTGTLGWSFPCSCLHHLPRLRTRFVFQIKRANSIVGFITGMLTFTPYRQWSWEHARHHATNGDLDRRGIGDIWTLTVEEYVSGSRRLKLSYRFIRNPIILFVFGPLVLFIILQRFTGSQSKGSVRRSVYIMNATLVVWCVGMSMIFGFLPWLVIQLTMMSIASLFGLWLFYVQHQFEDTYWATSEDWDYTTAAMAGSSYYNLPRVLQWFSGNIGYHHIHHLNPKIPNYNLERCHSPIRFSKTHRIALL